MGTTHRPNEKGKFVIYTIMNVLNSFLVAKKNTNQQRPLGCGRGYIISAWWKLAFPIATASIPDGSGERDAWQTGNYYNE